MSEYIYANITRGLNNAVSVAANIFVQLDKLNAQEASGYQGSDPHFTYQMHTLQLPVNDLQLLQIGDQVIDTQVIDVKTNQLRQYRIISDPDPNTLNMSWRWVCTRQRGT